MTRISTGICRKSPDVITEKRSFSACSRTSTTSNPLTGLKRYCIKSNRSSEIDESLFGKTVHMKNNNNTNSNAIINITKPREGVVRSYTCNKTSRPITVVSTDNIRKLKVLDHINDTKSLIINQSQYQRLLDHQKKSNDPNTSKETMALESLKRKEEFSNYDKLRYQKEALSDIEKGQVEESKRIIKRAWDLRLDDDFEIREVNEMVRNAKTQSIRLNQIAESAMIKNERLQEELKLHKSMEEERMKANKLQHERDKKRLENEYLAAISMSEQRNFKTEKLIEELKMQEEETFQAKQSVVHLINNEKSKEQLVLKNKQIFHQQQLDAFKASQERKKMEQIEEQLLNNKIMEIQKAKGEKERLDEEIRNQKAINKEKEYSKFRTMQVRYRDLQSERDELLAKRTSENLDRKWRQDQLEQTRKQKQIEHELKIIRTEQSQETLKNKVREAKRDEIIFNRYLNYEKGLIEKEKMDIQNKQTKKDRFTADILHQIEQNKRQKMVDDYNKAIEEETVFKERELQNIRLQEVKLRKLNELRSLGISEIFLNPIINHINNLKFRNHSI